MAFALVNMRNLISVGEEIKINTKALHKKTAQRFVVEAYLRYRMARTVLNKYILWRESFIKESQHSSQYDINFAQMIESWNNLQSVKRIYYNI